MIKRKITAITAIAIAMNISISKVPSMSKGTPNTNPTLAKDFLASSLSPSLLSNIPINEKGVKMRSQNNIESIGIRNIAPNIKSSAPTDSKTSAEIPYIGR